MSLNQISEIIKDRLYLSGLNPITNDKIKELKIDIIVSIINFQDNLNLDSVERIFYYAEDEDNFNIIPYFDSFNELAEQNPEKRILVHCHYGVSRSASLIASHLINAYHKRKLLTKYDITRILKIIRKKRDCIDPNDGFIRQLEYYRNSKL